jgi:hypothetical protein
MLRPLLTLCFLAGMGGLARAANVAPAAGPHAGRLQHTAEHIFQLADADKNGTLNPAEQAAGDLRAEKALRQLVHDNIIGGPIQLRAVAEPQLADPSAMTRPEFTQHFQALAAGKDAAVRAARIGWHQAPVSQPAAAATPVFFAGGGGRRERDKYDDDRLRDERNARDRRYRQDDRYYAPQQNYFQPNPFQPGAPPVFNTPAPDRGRQSGSDHASGSGHESGSKHEPVTKHEPPRNREPPARMEPLRGRGEHRGK